MADAESRPDRTESGSSPSADARHPIGVVTQRTGLSAHTLRAWERRYEAVEPTRTEGGHRLYSDEDVERLRLLHRLTLHGRPISQVADATRSELEALLHEDRKAEATAPGGDDEGADASVVGAGFLEEAYAAVESLDSGRLGALLRRAALRQSTEDFVEGLLVPLMTRIGRAWTEGDLHPAHEHMASAITTRVAGWLMDNFEPESGAPRIVISTPAGQHHELGALAAAVSAASQGWEVEYLGPDLPATDLAAAVREAGAQALALSIIFPSDDPSLEEDLRALREALPDGTPLLVGGSASEGYAEVLTEIQAVRLDGFRSLQAVLRTLRAEAEDVGI